MQEAMKAKIKPGSSAITRMEVLVIVAAMMVLAVCILPQVARTRSKSGRIACVDNLKRIGLSFKLWPGDTDRYQMRHSVTNGGTMEWVESGEAWPHFLVMSNELASPKILICPADRRQVAVSWAALSNTNISYFVALDAEETNPQGLLTGDSNLEIDGKPLERGLLDLWTNSVVGWTAERHQRCGNVALADGSTMQFSNVKFREQLANTGVATNRLAVP